MLDGDYTDNFNIIVLGSYLEMDNNPNGKNNVQYTDQDVHKYKFKNWGLEDKKHCKMDV